MNVTDVPAQTVVAEAAIVMLTGRIGFTVKESTFDVAGLPVAHTALEVSTHDTVLPLTGIRVYVDVVAPVTLLPLSFH